MAGLAARGEFEAEGRLEGELGYGIAMFDGGFTGTPHLGFGLSDTGRDYFGRHTAIIEKRKKDQKKLTTQNRRLNHQRQAA